MPEISSQDTEKSNQESEITDEDTKIFFSEVAKTAVRLLEEQPTRTTVAVAGREIEFGVSADVYFLAVTMKRVMVSLFWSLSDSLLDADNREPWLLVTERGNVEERTMKAISYRCSLDMNFPEVSIPLGEAFKQVAEGGSLKTRQWQLVNGEGKKVYLEAIGEKPQPTRVATPRVKAKVVFFGRDTPYKK